MFVCPYTERQFQSEEDFEDHIENWEQLKDRFLCRHCKFTAANNPDLIEHILDVHFVSVDKIIPTNARGNNVRVVTIFYSPEIIREKLRNAISKLKPGSKLTGCSFCQSYVDTGSETNLQNHILAQHLQSQKTANGNIWCPYCESEFVSEHCFRLHFGVSHCSQGRYPCLHCNNVLASKDGLLSHLMAVHGALVQPEIALSKLLEPESDESEDQIVYKPIKTPAKRKHTSPRKEKSQPKPVQHKPPQPEINSEVDSNIKKFKNVYKLYGLQRLTQDALMISLMDNLPKKVSENTVPPFFSCSLCKFTSDTIIRVLEHAVSCHMSCPRRKSNVIICSYCDQKISNDDKFDDHMLAKHQTANEFFCRICRFKTEEYTEFTNHMLIDHVSHWCDVWDFRLTAHDRLGSYRDSADIRLAIKEILKESSSRKSKTPACPFCSFEHKSEVNEDLFDHFILSHLATERMSDGYIYCHHCPGQFYSEVKYRTHLSECHASGTSASCPHCVSVTDDTVNMSKHQVKHHLDVLLPEILLLRKNLPHSVSNLGSNDISKGRALPDFEREIKVENTSEIDSYHGIVSERTSSRRGSSKRVSKLPSKYDACIHDLTADSDLSDSFSGKGSRKRRKKNEMNDSIENGLSKSRSKRDRKSIGNEINSSINSVSVNTSISESPIAENDRNNRVQTMENSLPITESECRASKEDERSRYSRAIVSFAMTSILSLKSESDSQTWQCGFCDMKANHRKTLLGHAITEHLVRQKLEQDDPIICSHCGSIFDSEKTYSEHMLQDHDTFSQYMCRNCEFTSRTIDAYYTHSIKVHFGDLSFLIPDLEDPPQSKVVSQSSEVSQSIPDQVMTDPKSKKNAKVKSKRKIKKDPDFDDDFSHFMAVSETPGSKKRFRTKDNAVDTIFVSADEIRHAFSILSQSDDIDEACRWCPFCPYESSVKDVKKNCKMMLRKHVVFQHLGCPRNEYGMITCHHCQTDHSSESELKAHIKTFHKQLGHACMLCAYTHPKNKVVQNHIIAAHTHILHPEYRLRKLEY